MGRSSAADGSRNLFTSLMLVLPLLILYHAGILLTGGMLNGADFITQLIMPRLGVQGYLVFLAIVTVGFLVALGTLHRKQHFNPRMVIPVLLESTIYALTMGSLIVMVMTRFLHVSPELSAAIASENVLTRFVMSLGAGVYEELVFRLGLLGGLVLLLGRVLKLNRWLAVTLAFVLSSLAFSAVHHIPPLGDPLRIGVFTFRTLAGLFFGVLFWFRGLAVAVYTHAIYDVFVLVIR
jgi:hypothetical protein